MIRHDKQRATTYKRTYKRQDRAPRMRLCHTFLCSWLMCGRHRSVRGARDVGAAARLARHPSTPSRTVAPFAPLKNLAHSPCTLHFLLASELLCTVPQLITRVRKRHAARNEPPRRPPQQQKNRSPDPLSPLLAVLAANLAVYVAWTTAFHCCCPPTAWMARHFLLSEQETTRHQYPHTALTARFSHIDVEHLVSNMVALIISGADLARKIGARKFSYFYIAASYASDFIGRKLFPRRGFRRPVPRRGGRSPPFFRRPVPAPMRSLGASGAISAVQMCFTLHFPTKEMRLDDIGGSAAASLIRYLNDIMALDDKDRNGHIAALGGYIFGALFDIKIPAAAASLIWVLGEVMALNDKDGIGHGAHLGGCIFGALFYAADTLASIIWKRVSKFIICRRGKRKFR
mmetsp:Transcript_3171/g.6549  ORF Transcript_3171/g.6549 Transcript_3171/m.6549 type:complete len:402 (+) Transcript_3171:312-1517(+)